jgi:signal transduction histidine kinase
VERRRLVLELSHATSDRLAGLRADVAAARADLRPGEEDGGSAGRALARARTGLDELLDRFRVIARGVYPAVLRDQGPAGALDEVAADLGRPVRITGELDGRLAWEIESGLYYVAAAALHELAGAPAEDELVMHLEHADGRVSVLVDDPRAPVGPARLRAALSDDGERLVALGGAVEVTGGPGDAAADGDSGLVVLRAWLPDRLEPLVEASIGAELTVRR